MHKKLNENNINKNNLSKIEEVLANYKIKKVAMLAPSFLTDFSYPSIINQLKALGFNAVVEVTFGAKIVNREYQTELRQNSGLLISSSCPGIVEMIKNNPELRCFEKNIIPVDSPMIAMGKVCRKIYRGYKIFFITPCLMKKKEANSSSFIDYTIDYQQLRMFFEHWKIKTDDSITTFDRLYNDYTKVYPLSGGLTKTAKIQKIIKSGQYKIKDGWPKVNKLLLKIKNNPQRYKNLKFLDVTFCEGGCIGGPCTDKTISIREKYHLVKSYMKNALREKIPERKKGLFAKIRGIVFKKV